MVHGNGSGSGNGGELMQGQKQTGTAWNPCWRMTTNPQKARAGCRRNSKGSIGAWEHGSDDE